ncbi:glutamine--fructose-6-phosphate transaminase (isomerizing) [Candidatus Giovannonibacteria bacterium]|nr:glutamine--fructose-6-phosphate transaminase (isomerizing) [Candidatus Giovannonibacteria bacterium]
MCGINGYVGKGRDAALRALDGILKLKYRGYDSAGIVFQNGGEPVILKVVGDPVNLEQRLSSFNLESSIAIAHNRWATHGVPSEENAHPHSDCTGTIFLVHNGIIENYRELRDELIAKGHVFRSQTDTEVAVHLVEEWYVKGKTSLEFAVKNAIARLRGKWAFLIYTSDDPETLIATRFGSPLLLGIGEDGYYAASSAAPFVGRAENFILLEDGDTALLNGQVTIFDQEGRQITREAKKLDWELETAQRGGFPHFMLKEIFDQPDAISNSMAGRINPSGEIKFEELDGVDFGEVGRILIIGCGTSYFAGRQVENLFEEIAEIPAKTELASEFRYRSPVLCKNDLAIFISQSGETTDTYEALQVVKNHGVATVGIVNVMNSSIARELDRVIYQRVGLEIGVASTKAFSSQVVILMLLAFHIARSRGKKNAGEKAVDELLKIPVKIGEVLRCSEQLQKLAEKYYKHKNFFFIGRKNGFAIANEGALKLKEVSYVHAEGYGAGEMKHGPIALIDPSFVTLAIAPEDSVYRNMISNINEVRARKGRVISLATEGDGDIGKISDDVVYLPETIEELYPFLEIVALQLFAYYFAVALQYNPDQPRNLAKSVTVE